MVPVTRPVPVPGHREHDEYPDREGGGGQPLPRRVPLRPVDHGAGEHQRQDHAAGPRVGVALVERDEDEGDDGRERRSRPGRPGPGKHGEREAGEDQRVGDAVEHQLAGLPGAVRPVGERRHRKDAAERDRADRERRRVPAAAPVHAPAEQPGEQQVEDHLVGQRPGHDRHVEARDEVLQHEHPAEGRGRRVVPGVPDVAVPGLVRHGGEQERHEEHRVEPERAADPESAHGPLALQGSRHDIATDQEKHENAVLTQVKPLVQEGPDGKQQQGGPVVEDHAQRGKSTQGVKPSQPSFVIGRSGLGHWLDVTAVLAPLALLPRSPPRARRPLFLPSSVSRSYSVSPLASARPEGGLCSLVAQSLVPRSLAPQSAQAAGALRLAGRLPPSSVRGQGRALRRALSTSRTRALVHHAAVCGPHGYAGTDGDG